MEAFSLIRVSLVVEESGIGTDVVMNSEPSLLGVATKFEFTWEQMASNMKRDATKNCLEDRLSISLSVCVSIGVMFEGLPIY